MAALPEKPEPTKKIRGSALLRAKCLKPDSSTALSQPKQTKMSQEREGKCIPLTSVNSAYFSISSFVEFAFMKSVGIDCSLVLPERENVPVKTEYISVKYMTC